MSDELGSILEYDEDITDAEAPASLPTNQYPGEIIGAENGVSQNSGRPRVQVDWRINPEDFPPDYADAESFADGKVVSTWVPSGKDKASKHRMRRFCETIGAKTGKNIDINSWIGKKALLSIEEDDFEGVPRERVRKVDAL